MSGCSHEAHNHGHDHGHDHEHDHDGPDRGFEFNLYKHIDLPNVRCLNESKPDSCQLVFKPWDERLDLTKSVESDADEQLIIFIPFTGSVKLKSIAVFGPPGDDSNPSKMKAHDVDFDSVENIKADQEWELIKIDSPQVPEYPTKMTKFTNVRNLTLYIPENYGDEITKITYIGLKGEFKEIPKDPVITLYEAAANPSDHKTKLETTSGHTIH